MSFPLCPGKGLCPSASLAFDTSCARTRYPELEQFHAGLDLYFNQGIRPGRFLTAVLSNNLVEAFGRADPRSVDLLPRLVELVFHYAPAMAWGSPQAFDAWRDRNRRAPAPEEPAP